MFVVRARDSGVFGNRAREERICATMSVAGGGLCFLIRVPTEEYEKDILESRRRTPVSTPTTGKVESRYLKGSNCKIAQLTFIFYFYFFFCVKLFILTFL